MAPFPGHCTAAWGAACALAIAVATGGTTTGAGAAEDLLATADRAKAQRDLDPRRWLLVGRSAGRGSGS